MAEQNQRPLLLQVGPLLPALQDALEALHQGEYVIEHGYAAEIRAHGGLQLPGPPQKIAQSNCLVSLMSSAGMRSQTGLMRIVCSPLYRLRQEKQSWTRQV